MKGAARGGRIDALVAEQFPDGAAKRVAVILKKVGALLAVALLIVSMIFLPLFP